MRDNSAIPVGFCQCGCGQKTNIASRTRPEYGYIKGQPYPFIYNHSKAKGRLDNYVIEDRGYETPCWIWQGTVDKRQGYGSIKVNRKMLKVHRVMYEQMVGPIPEGLELDHLCRVRNCMNPTHLEPVTGLVNIRRGAHVKLSYEDVEQIVAISTEFCPREIAIQFNVSYSHICRILKHRKQFMT